jgi:hypothetical protein
LFLHAKKLLKPAKYRRKHLENKANPALEALVSGRAFKSLRLKDRAENACARCKSDGSGPRLGFHRHGEVLVALRIFLPQSLTNSAGHFRVNRP